MGDSKFVKLQAQIKNDQSDLQDFFRDLKSWESDIKKQDEKLKVEKEKENSDETLPPVRNRVVQKKYRKKKKPKETQWEKQDSTQKGVQAKSRIGGYDYRAWDTFDVDKACAEVDSEDQGSNSEMETDSETEREEIERQRKIQEAHMEKEQGNTYFKESRYEDAITCYTRGMVADSTNAILPANRAMALLKLKRYEEAEKDCSSSISLDCTYVKAYARRGSARLGLDKLEEARKDFEQVLELEPSNKQAATEIKRIDENLFKQKQMQREEAAEPNLVKPIHKPPHLRSKKPLRRIEIEEVGSSRLKLESPDVISMSHGHSTRQSDSYSISLHQTWEKGPFIESMGDTVEESNGSHSDSQGTTVNTEVRNNIQEISSHSAPVFNLEETEALPSPVSSAPLVEPSSSAASTPSSSKPVVSITSKPSSTSSPVTPSLSPSPPLSIPPVPSSSFQLESDWKRLQKTPHLLYQYFKQIPPESYSKILQHSLDSKLLSSILQILKDSFIPCGESVVLPLQCLCQVKRFDMNVMFMTKEDKKMVCELFDYMKSTESTDSSELNKLTKRYGL